MALPLEIPADVLVWMRTQSKSAFIGDMLRVYERTGGLTRTQLDAVVAMKQKAPA